MLVMAISFRRPSTITPHWSENHPCFEAQIRRGLHLAMVDGTQQRAGLCGRLALRVSVVWRESISVLAPKSTGHARPSSPCRPARSRPRHRRDGRRPRCARIPTTETPWPPRAPSPPTSRVPACACDPGTDLRLRRAYPTERATPRTSSTRLSESAASAHRRS